MPTLTGWEQKIRTYADEHGLALGRGKVQRLALRIDKRARSYWDPDLEAYFLQYPDETGEHAAKHVDNPLRQCNWCGRAGLTERQLIAGVVG